MVGLRQQMGVRIIHKSGKGLKWKTRRIDGIDGSNICMEVFAGGKLPPYTAYSVLGKGIESFGRCRAMQARLYVKDKMLSAQLVVNNSAHKEAVFVHELLEIQK